DQAVDDEVVLGQAPLGGDVGDQPLGDLQLPLLGAGLALFVGAQAYDRRTVIGGRPHRALEAAVRPGAVLVVARVGRSPATQVFQPHLDDGRFGGVHHDREGGGGGQPAGQLLHVLHAVPADVVHAEVEHVRALAGLRLGDLHAVVVTALEHRFAELLGA